MRCSGAGGFLKGACQTGKIPLAATLDGHRSGAPNIGTVCDAEACRGVTALKAGLQIVLELLFMDRDARPPYKETFAAMLWPKRGSQVHRNSATSATKIRR